MAPLLHFSGEDETGLRDEDESTDQEGELAYLFGEAYLATGNEEEGTQA